MTGRVVNILLVEDDDVDAEAVQRAFEKRKIANPIKRAKDGVEALEMLRGENGHMPFDEPYLLLVDLNMPRLDGIGLLREIRADKHLNRTIAFILTTSKNEEDKIKAYDLNVAGYSIKSNVGNDFVHMVEMLDHYWTVVEFP